MDYMDLIGRGPGQLAPPRRNNYFYGKLLDVPHLQMEQGYTVQIRRLLNRLSLGAGVLCGLGVEESNGQLCVLPGVAVDELGREIIVPERFCLDPWQLTDRCGHIQSELSREREQTIMICLAYDECLTDYMPVLVSDCNTHENCAPGTIVETFRVQVRPEVPQQRPGGLPPEVCAALFGPDAGGNRGDYTLVATITVGGQPSGIAISHDARRALVLNEIGGTPRLQVIDIASNTIIHELADDRLKLPFGGVSIAPEGGPALVTHQGGLAIIDLEAEPPAITANILAETPYGICAAAFTGETLFALNLNPEQPGLDRIDITAQTVMRLQAGSGIVDLAVSPPDSRWLYVATAPDAPLLRIDTGTNQVANPPSIIDRAARTLAVRATPAGPEARVAYAGLLRVFGESAPSTDQPLAIDPRDSAFTSDGARYYVLSAAPNTTPELVIFNSADHHTLARVPVGPNPFGLALVPDRLRALVTNAGNGTVSVIDLGPLDRHRLLCELLSGPCPSAPAESCVPLAAVQLLPGSRIGRIEICAYRPMLYSNAVLLDLILCLAARVDECCGQQPPPPPPVVITIDPPQLPNGRVGVIYPAATIVASGGTAPYTLTVSNGTLPPGLGITPTGIDQATLSGTPTQAGTYNFMMRAVDANNASATRQYSVTIDRDEPPPNETLQIKDVLFLELRDGALEPFENLRFGQDYTFPVSQLRGIRVIFTHDIDLDSVTTAPKRNEPPDQYSFLVLWMSEAGASITFPGTIQQDAGPNTATFLPAEEFDRHFPPNEYTVTLFGNDGPQRRAIRIAPALGQDRLDGEGLSATYPNSGDGTEGGNFAFRFRVG